MTTKESMQLYCKQHDDCSTCALYCVCTNFRLSSITDLSDNEFNAFMYEVNSEINRLQFYTHANAIDFMSKLSLEKAPVMAFCDSETLNPLNQQESPK